MCAGSFASISSTRWSWAKFTTAEQSYDELGLVDAQCGENPRRLELPFRTSRLCTGDMGFAAAKNVRHRGLVPEPEDVSRDFVVQQHRIVPDCRYIRHRPTGTGKAEFAHTLETAPVSRSAAR